MSIKLHFSSSLFFGYYLLLKCHSEAKSYIPQRMCFKPYLKILVELFTDNFNCCNKPCIVEFSSIFFSTFLSVALSARVSVCSTPIDYFYFIFYYFFYSLILSAIFFSNVFYFNTTRYWFDVTTCELE
jgi:hypothetical protein